MYQSSIYAIIFILLYGCHHTHSNTEDNEPEPYSYTLYSEQAELFVEFPPLIAGGISKFATHVTVMGESFVPLQAGKVTLIFNLNGKTTTVISEKPVTSGIFSISLQPETAGIGRLTFKIEGIGINETFNIDSVTVFPNEKTALENQPQQPTGDVIVFLKEQAWKTDFAAIPVKKQLISEVIKTSGQIISAPGDEMIVTAKSGGLVLFTGSKNIPGSEVSSGALLFTISGGALAESNIDVIYRTAKSDFEKAKADYERALDLVEDKVISQKDFLDAKLKFENAQTHFKALAKNYSANGQVVNSPISGFVKNIFVSEGQYVQAGAPLAIISKNRKLLLRAQVSQKYAERLPQIFSAHFKTPGNPNTIRLSDLNGKVVSFGKSIDAQSPFLPVTFEFDNMGSILPGAVAEVYLLLKPETDALTVPVSALLEEQGLFHVYVQTGGETFEKRELKTGISDGMNIQILSGVNEGERVVVKGVYPIKLSAATGAIPEHGHEH